MILGKAHVDELSSGAAVDETSSGDRWEDGYRDGDVHASIASLGY